MGRPKKQIDPKVVERWCPDCDRLQQCTRVGRFLLECNECGEPIEVTNGPPEETD